MAVSPVCDLFVAAGEASGDAYGAAVVEHLRELMPDLVVAGMGGTAMRSAGVEIETSSEGMGVMGFLPVLARLPTFVATLRQVAAIARARRPKVVLTIDYPGFNFRLLRRLADLRRAGTRFIHLVAPQVWAWRPRRAKRIAASVDRLLCLFPFEPPLFNRHGGRADFVGHPLPDLIPDHPDTGEVEHELGLARDDRLLLLAPGSREREVRGLLPIFDAAAHAALPLLTPPAHGRIVVAIAKAPDLPLALYRGLCDLPVVEGRYRECCARAQVALIASGTATLEAAIIGVPHIITYRTDPLSGVLARHLVIVKHIGLPNIVHGARVCPEVVQRELTVPRLVAHLRRLWEGDARTACLARLATTRAVLGGSGAMTRIAATIAEELARGRRRADTLSDLDPVTDHETRRRTRPGA